SSPSTPLKKDDISHPIVPLRSTRRTQLANLPGYSGACDPCELRFAAFVLYDPCVVDGPDFVST
ncbi:MAG: hypothetical protein ACKON9_08100, partial [Planctomycetaceae bacterium]